MAKTPKAEEAAPQGNQDKPKPHPNLPVVEEKKVEVKELSNAPKDEDFVKGWFKDRETGEVFSLAVHEPDDYFRTHSLKNSLHFQQVTEAEFRLRFDKAD